MKITAVDTFQMQWDRPGSRSAFVQIRTDGDVNGIGEASPMQGGMASLGIIARDIAPVLIGTDPLDHGAVLDQVRHQLIKLGPDGALAGALAAVDIALWDLKGKLLGLPIHRILGGARRSRLPFYASIGGNAGRTVEGVLDVVKTRLDDEHPQLVKIRWDGDRTKLDADIPGDIAKAKAVRAMVGDDFPLAFDANNGYSVGGAIRVGRALEDLGFLWFEEPVQHYHVKATGEVAQRLDITVSAGEQTYTLQGVADLIDAGVRMVQPEHRQDGRDLGPDGVRRALHGLRGRASSPPDPAHHRAYREPARAGQSPALHEASRTRRQLAAGRCCLPQPAHAGKRALRYPDGTGARPATRPGPA